MAKEKNAAASGKKSAAKPKAKPKPNWTVKEALEDGQAAVKRGSGLPLRPSAERALFDHYRHYFEEKHEKCEDWHAARERIMMLSQFVGALACLLTIFKDFSKKRSAPVAVDAKSAVQAAELVSFISKYCFLGGWCPVKEFSDSLLREALGQELGMTLSTAQSAQLLALLDGLRGSLGPSR